MALRFVDGFDHYTFAQLARKWDIINGTHTISTSGARNGSALTFAITLGGSTANIAKYLDNQPTWIIGFAIRLPTFPPNTSRGLFSLNDSTGVTSIGLDQVTLCLDYNTALLTVKRGTATSGTVLGVSSIPLPIGIWCYLESKVTIHNTTGIFVVRLNGQTILNLSGVNTRGGTANNYANCLNFNPTGIGFAISIDDFYYCDATGSVNNDFLGDIKVETLFPDGDGANLTWTPSSGTTHSTLIDENPANDDTDYISTNTVGNIDTHLFTNLVTTTGTIKGVQMNWAARADDGVTTHNTSPVIRGSDSVNYVGSANAALTQLYTLYWQTYNVNPQTTSAFTIAEINAGEYGVKLIA